MEQNRVGEIYVDDVLITSPTDLSENKAQAYRVAYGMLIALASYHTAPRYVKVQIPGDAAPDLWVDYRYRFQVRIGDNIATTYASGQLVEGDYGTLGEVLAIGVHRTFLLATSPPATTAPSTP